MSVEGRHPTVEARLTMLNIMLPRRGMESIKWHHNVIEQVVGCAVLVSSATAKIHSRFSFLDIVACAIQVGALVHGFQLRTTFTVSFMRAELRSGDGH